MKAKDEKEESALSQAYEAVMNLRYTQSMLMKIDHTVNHHTLGRIRNNLPVKNVTERYYLRLFVSLINKEYKQRLADGGDGAAEMLVVMRKILLSDLMISVVER